MAITNGARVGTYQISALIGKGGMGEVYRARDSALKRDVAIKVLPDGFSSDAGRVARFQREAEILASLNHPHIAAIYGLEHAGESRYLILELVDGETLADRIKRGQIPVGEALPIARQVAEALEVAHEKGITHRDLKPANIKVTPDRVVKVLDFGLAKVHEAGPVSALADSPTVMSASTPGVILGTPAYMSPEQANGKETDRTTDVWAFGCLLYEMLTGRAAFEGESVGEILGGVFRAEPDWTLLPEDTPQAVRRLLQRCLRKDRRQRLHDIADVRIELEDASIEAPAAPARGRVAPRRREQFAWAALALVIILAALAAIFQRVRPEPSEALLSIVPPAGTSPFSATLSPDGQKIAFVTRVEGRARLSPRPLKSSSFQHFTGTDGALQPFWSWDSASIGFFADGKLKRYDIASGSVQTLANAPAPRGGAWNRDNVILFAPDVAGPLLRVSASAGGEAVEATRLDAPRQANHRYPHFLPDGRHFLYYATGAPGARGVYVGELGESDGSWLVDADSTAVYASSGQLLFVRRGTLYAQDFDAASATLSGEPRIVSEQVMVNNANLAAVSTSAAGPIVYTSGTLTSNRQFALFDRTGREIQKVGPASVATISKISSEGLLATNQTVDGNMDIYSLELGRALLAKRLTTDPANEANPVWSPKGDRIVFSSDRNGSYDLWEKSLSSDGTERALLELPGRQTPDDWSPNERFILYRGDGLWALPLEGERKPFLVAGGKFDVWGGQFSPDGMWVAYMSNESGSFEVYVRPFPGPGKETRLSLNGGAAVRWSSDGSEVYYVAPDSRLMAVRLRYKTGNTAVEALAPEPLFPTIISGNTSNVNTPPYAVYGQRFLMPTGDDQAAAPAITIILNWKRESDTETKAQN